MHAQISIKVVTFNLCLYTSVVQFCHTRLHKHTHNLKEILAIVICGLLPKESDITHLILRNNTEAYNTQSGNHGLFQLEKVQHCVVQCVVNNNFSSATVK